MAISAAASVRPSTGGSLPANQLVVHLGADGPGGLGGPLPQQTPAQLAALTARVAGIAASLHAGPVLALDEAVNPAAPVAPGPGNAPPGKEPVSLVKVISEGQRSGERLIAGLYVATPTLLDHYGINSSQIDPTADIVTSRTDLAGLQLFYGRDQVVHPQNPESCRSPPIPPTPPRSSPRTQSTVSAWRSLRPGGSSRPLLH